MNKDLDVLDWITILSFEIVIYALYIALKNLKENEDQNNELKNILHYLEIHLQSQDEHLHQQDSHLENQDKILENLTR